MPPPGPLPPGDGGGVGGSPPPPCSPVGRSASDLLSNFLEAKGELRHEEDVIAAHLPPPSELRPRVGEEEERAGRKKR